MSGSFKEKLLLYRLESSKDPEAFAELYDLYAKRIYRFVYFKVSGHEEAEDITSEVFLKAWNYINEGKEVKSFSGLLYRIARNCVIDMYRNKYTHPESALTQDLEVGDGGKWYEDLNVHVEAKQIIHALKKLKQEYREVLTLRYVDELSAEEIAEITGKGKIAVRVTMHRALARLKQIIEGGK